jgi:hypothetical protein
MGLAAPKEQPCDCTPLPEVVGSMLFSTAVALLVPVGDARAQTAGPATASTPPANTVQPVPGAMAGK